MSAMEHERTKLTATYINGIAIATFAVGGFAPLVARLSTGEGLSVLIALLCTTGLVTSTVMHLIARYLLRGLAQ